MLSQKNILFFFLFAPLYLTALPSHDAIALSSKKPPALAAPIINYHYRIVEQFPHSTESFTQGLEFSGGLLYEGSGRYGQSKIVARTLGSITPIKSRHNSSTIFGEGISLLNQKLYQLSWKSGRVFEYLTKDFSLQQEFTIEGEGWGLTNNGKQLIYSDGSSQLTFVDPKNFSSQRKLTVIFKGKPLTKLNELEWINGLIYANIWQSNTLVIINPKNGQVVGQVQLNHLLPSHLRNKKTDVLNGIAYDHEKKRLLVTGKNWPYLYHIELINNP